MTWRARARLVIALTLTAPVAAAGCERAAGEALALLGVRFLQPLALDAAVERALDGSVLVLAAREGEPPSLPVLRLAPDAPLPGALVAEERWVLVMSAEPDAALALAARLSRAGAARIAVVEAHDVDSLRRLANAAGSAAADRTP